MSCPDPAGLVRSCYPLAYASGRALSNGISNSPVWQVLSDSRAEDDRLYKVYNANFGGSFGLDLLHLTHGALHAGGTLETWRSVLTAMEGQSFGGQPMNMMTLLRADAHASYDPEETDLILVPRAQFLLIEIARNRQGIYSGLKAARLTVELGRATDALAVSLQQHDAARTRAALCSMAVHHVVPEGVLKDTGAARLVGSVAKYSDCPPQWLRDEGSAPTRKELGSMASALRAQWKGGLAVLKLNGDQRAAAVEWLGACLAVPVHFGEHTVGGEVAVHRPLTNTATSRPEASGDPAAPKQFGNNIPPAAFSELDAAGETLQSRGDSIRVWCRMIPVCPCLLRHFEKNALNLTLLWGFSNG